MSQTLTVEPVKTQLPLDPFYVPTGSGPFFELGDHRGYVKVSSQVTEGQFLLAEIHADYLGGVPLHVHHREEETFFILKGRFVFMVGNDRIEVGPGDTIFGPRDTAHSWVCVSPEGGSALFFFTPGENFEAFAIAMAMQDLHADSTGSGETDFVALTQKHGIEMLAGPGSHTSYIEEAGAVA